MGWSEVPLLIASTAATKGEVAALFFGQQVLYCGANSNSVGPITLTRSG
jgi:hypothetical protein